MKRVALTNGSGAWFDSEKAECFRENSYHDGRNFISKATNSQFEHEAIFVTKSGKFILDHWSNWQGSTETYQEITKERASAWFAKQGFSDDEIPKALIDGVNEFEIL